MFHDRNQAVLHAALASSLDKNQAVFEVQLDQSSLWRIETTLRESIEMVSFLSIWY